MYQYRNLHLLEIPFKNKSEKDFLILDFIVVVVQSLSRVSLRPHGLQHASLPCTSPSPGIGSNSCPSSQWCHPAISSSVVPFSSCLQSIPASESFQWVNSSHEVAKYWSFSFSISPSKEDPGLISFRMDWVDLLAVQGTLKSLLQHHSSKASQYRIWYCFCLNEFLSLHL